MHKQTKGNKSRVMKLLPLDQYTEDGERFIYSSLSFFPVHVHSFFLCFTFIHGIGRRSKDQ